MTSYYIGREGTVFVVVVYKALVHLQIIVTKSAVVP